MGEKSLIIVNPVSGKIDKSKIDFSKYFSNCKIINWESPETDISKLVKEELKKERYNNIIVAGGDGTVNKVAQIIVNTDYTLGIIPLGSGNGLARHLGIPMNIEKSIKIILEGNNKKIDGTVVSAGVLKDCIKVVKVKRNNVISQAARLCLHRLIARWNNANPARALVSRLPF